MNHFSGVVDKNPHYYTWLQQDVADTGFNLLPKFALGATLLAAPIAWTSTQWATYSVEQGGEIKGARVFKNQMFIIVGSLIAVGISPGGHRLGRAARRGHRLLQRRVGLLLRRDQRLGQRHRQRAARSPACSPSSSRPTRSSSCWCAVSFMLASLQITCNCYIGMTRVMVGMSLDRTLPAWLSKVSPRFRTPVNAHLVYFVAGRAHRSSATATWGVVHDRRSA